MMTEEKKKKKNKKKKKKKKKMKKKKIKNFCNGMEKSPVVVEDCSLV